ncbi:MAG: hypothetical protein H0U70_02730 [Tatlockia sp.]|nr:hypothetical protein [Tatlockia sp.]
MGGIFENLKKFTQNLEELKASIQLSKPSNHKWERSRAFLKREDANQDFADPLILPNNFSIPQNAEFVSPANSPYPDNVLQALWNIADIVIGSASISGVALLVWDSTELNQNFGYLDNYASRVPKIVDKKTLLAGKALLKFLNQIDLNDLKELFDTFKIGNFYQQNAEIINEIKPLLDKRIKVYEAFNPEILSETNELRSKVAKIQADLDINYVSKLKEQKNTLIQEVELSSKLINNSLSSEEELEKSLNQLTTCTDLVKKNLDSFITNYEAAIEGDAKLSKPVKSSVFTEFLETYKRHQTFENYPFLEDDKANLISEWLMLYNNDEIKLVNEDLLKAANGFYKNSVAFVNLDLNKAAKQIIFLKIKIERVKSRLDFITIVKGKAVAAMTESTNDDKETAFIENIRHSSDLVNKLKIYQKTLIDSKLNLNDAELSKQFDIPQTVLNNAKSFYLAKIDEELLLIKPLIQNTIEKKETYTANLAKMSSAGKQRVIAMVDSRVHTAFQQLEKSKKQESQLNFQNYLFINREFEPTKKAISQNYDPQIAKLDGQINERLAILSKAHSKLEEFKQIISENTEIYLPIDKISQEELIQHLDLHPKSQTAKNIKAIYAESEAALSWSLLNSASHVLNRISSTIFPSYTYFQQNAPQLLTLIEKKIVEISTELTSDYEDTSSKEPETNLHNLNKAKKKLNNLKIEKMSGFILQKRELTQAIKKIKLTVTLDQFKYQLASVASKAQHLEYRLDAVDNLLADQSTDEKAKLKSILGLLDNSNRDNSFKRLHSDFHNQLIGLGNSLETLTKMPELKLSQNQIETFVGELQSLGKKDAILMDRKGCFFEKILPLTTNYQKMKLEKELTITSQADFKEKNHQIIARGENQGSSSISLAARDRKLNAIHEQFFSKNPESKGSFFSYLTERSSVHFLKDCFSKLAALFLGNFYLTPEEERRDYINNLSLAFKHYQRGDFPAIAVTAEIVKGKEKYNPNEDGEAYDQKLANLLSELRLTILDFENEFDLNQEQGENITLTSSSTLKH